MFSTNTNNLSALIIRRNFIFNFKQYFRFFIFFKFLLRYSLKKNVKGRLPFFFLLPKLKKSRTARMGKGNGAFKGFFWQGVSGTTFLSFKTYSSFFYYFMSYRLSIQLPCKLVVSLKKSTFFNFNFTKYIH